ncbi:MAG: hypothetical protein SVQ76_01750, partial [Candidatus Nanohaloarchaea archaeon]|nr:hypothetical protein [Candidatus Nanohaloarchaea archaeon]
PNSSFDPDYFSEGSKTLVSWVFDRASNALKNLFEFTVDVEPPTVDSISPGNDSYIATDDKITINASDDRSFSHLTVNDTSGNTTYSSADVNFDPGWTKEGQKTLKVWVNDSAGNTAFFSYDYTLDDTPPSVTGISPSNRSNILNSTLVEVNVSDSGAGNGVLVFNDGSSNTTFASGDSLDPAWTTEGSHNLTLYLNDTVDNLESVLYRYTVDETRPDSSSNYSSPQGWNGGDQDIRLEAYDNLGLEGIYYCTYSEDQSPCTPSTFSSSNLTVTVSCSSGNTCNRTVRFRSNDTAGNLEDVNETAPVKIDEEAPAVTIDNPKEGDDEGGIVSLSTEISDAGIGVLDANYTVVNASNLSDFEKTGDLNLSNGWDAEWNSSAAVDKNGTFVFNVTASDDLGHSVEVNVTFDVDNRQPVNTIKEPVQEYLNGDFNLVIEAKRPGNEQIQNHTYFVFQSSNPSNIVNRSTATGGLGDAHNFSWTVNVNSSWTDGNFSINTTAFDTASNPESAFDRTWFVLDREDPDAEVTSPGNGSWQEGKISVGYRALDTVKNGSCNWRWRDDGGAWNGNFSLGCGTSSFSFDTADCDDDSSADCEVDVMAEDEAGNLNISRLELKVDNTPPDVSFDGPPSGTWHKTDFEVDFTASDTISPVQTCKWRNATSGWQTTDCTSNFTVDISNYCSVEGSKKCDIKLLAENAPGLTAKTGFREFSIDTSLPYVTGVVPSNYSIVNSTDELELTFRDDVSGVKVAVRNNGTRNASLSSGVSFDPGWSASGEETLTVWLNDSADNLLRKKYVYRVDVEPPSIVDSRFNVSKDPRYGDTRIFRGEPIRFLANLTDDFNVSQAKVTVNYTGTNSAENYSLTFLEGDRTGGVWKLDYTGTGKTGLYNVTRAYLYDSAGHLNSTVAGLPSFRVVNHSLTAELGGDDAVDAGHTENLNLTIELNRTASPFVRVFVPPSTASDLVEPEYTNTTRYECSFGDASCTLDYDRVNGEIAALNVSTTGSDTSLTITANVSAPAPADDTTHTWTSSLEGDREEDTTTVQTPLLNVSASYCDGATTCSIDQRQEFNLTVTVSNENTTSHTGASRDVLVNLSSSELGISRQESVGDLATGSESNATFTLNVSEAGTFSIEAEAYDSFTEEYSDTRGVDVDIVDITPPNISSPGLDETTVNVNSSVILETTSSDNVGVEAVTATFLNTTGPEENVSLSLESGDRKLGSWEFDYNSTSTPGTYNVTRIYANDSAGNTYSEFLNLSFEVSELSVDVSLNTSSPSFHSPVKVTANVTGNASAIDYVTANVSKPRGAFEAFNLSFSSAGEGYVYAGTYMNTSRSGSYDVNVTVEGGATAYNATRTFSTPFGQPGSEPLHGNGSRILVPTGTSPNVTWQVEPVQGDLEDANTSLSISNTSVIKLASGQKSFEFTGNVTYEGGAEAVGYLLEPVAKGTAELNLSVNTSRGFNYSTVTAEVDSADNTAPSITGYNETPDLANKNQGIVIEANASDLSVLKNVTVTVQHPESGSNYTETPEKMEQVDRGSYRYVFTNTSEAGHYTYTLETWDIAGNYQRNVSKSFNVTGDYTVEVNTSYSIYRKGEDVSFDVVVEDANGDSVEDFNTTLILDRSGTNTTLLTNNRTGTASYSIERSDPPSASLLASQLPLSYTVHVNVSKNGNMGSDVYDFNVTRLIDRDLNTLFQNPQQGDAVEPGSTFNVTLDVNYPRGDPVTGAVVYARCNTCPSDFKFLEHQGNGIYSENFTAPTDSDSALIRAFVDDGSGNSESQADQAAPAISIDVTTATNDTGTAGGGGGGGGGAGVLPPQLQITRLSPGLNLPSDVRSVNLSVSTSMDAACRYSRRDVGFQSATEFSSTGGGTHHSRVEVSPGSSYSYHVYCRTPDNLSASTIVPFSVAQEEISSYMFRVPQEPLRIPLGGNGTAQINLYNNGTEPLTSELSARSSCCGTRFRTLRGEPVDEVEMEKGSGKVVELLVSVPLNISTGRKTVLVASTVGNSRRERTVIVEAYRGELVKRIEDIVSRSQRLLERIKLYRRSGIDTSELQRSYIELQQIIQDAREAKAADNRTGFVRNLEQAESRANAIDARLEILSFRQYVYANWWRWLLGGTGIYVVFFLITMVAIPYYRTRTELLNVQRKLENAVEARKNAEKQYFRREIDRDTFMEIMTERQDEILELRGERDSLQEELDNMLRRQLTPENFVKAPLKAFREINAWIEQMRERGETGEE